MPRADEVVAVDVPLPKRPADVKAPSGQRGEGAVFPDEREGLAVVSRRNVLKAGMAGMAGLSLPALLRGRARASEAGRPPAGPTMSSGR